MKLKPSQGVTLIELLIVLAIAGIIAAIALPNYSKLIQDKRHLQGETILLDILQRQEHYFTNNRTYTLELNLLGYTEANANIENEEFYKVRASLCPNEPITECVKLIGTPVHQDDNTLSITSRNDTVIHN